MASEAAAKRQLTPYAAHYVSEVLGLKINLTRMLNHTEDDGYELVSSGKKMLYGFHEASNFYATADFLRPANYHYAGSGLNRRETQTSFNWAELTARSLYKGKEYSINLSKNILDPLNWQEFMRIKLLQGSAPDAADLETLSVLDGRRIKHYKMRFNGAQLIDTPAGQFQALHFTRLGRKPGRNLDFWLATDWEYLMIRAEYMDEDKQTIVAALTQATLNNQPVTGEQAQ